MKKTIFYLVLASTVFGLTLLCCGGDGNYTGGGWGGDIVGSSSSNGGGGDCDDACAKIAGCCDWGSEESAECIDECEEIRSMMTDDEFDEFIKEIMDASCSDLEGICYGYSYGYDDYYGYATSSDEAR